MQVKEYKRTCKECGKVWHSLVDREKQIQGQICCDLCSGFAFCTETGTAAQYSRNADANTSELNRLKKCPECQSSNYIEEIITFEKE